MINVTEINHCLEPNLVHNDDTVCDGTDGAVAKRSTAALHVAGSIPTRNKYLYGLQIVVPGLGVCVRVFLCF